MSEAIVVPFVGGPYDGFSSDMAQGRFAELVSSHSGWRFGDYFSEERIHRYEYRWTPRGWYAQWVETRAA